MKRLLADRLVIATAAVVVAVSVLFAYLRVAGLSAPEPRPAACRARCRPSGACCSTATSWPTWR